MCETDSVRDLDNVGLKAKSDFKQNAIPVILAKYSDIDSQKLSKFCEDFFEIFCDLNQISAANVGKDSVDSMHLDTDIHAQWQYYAAFFFKKLNSDCDLYCTYNPVEISYLELEMSCPREDTFGLDSEKSKEIFGSVIRYSMNVCEGHFGSEPLNTMRIIPIINESSNSRLFMRLDEESHLDRLMAEQPLALAHVPNQSELVLSA